MALYLVNKTELWFRIVYSMVDQRLCITYIFLTKFSFQTYILIIPHILETVTSFHNLSVMYNKCLILVNYRSNVIL